MPAEISYHIVDFKVDDDDIKILELGNAFYGSDLSERMTAFNNTEAMLRHAAQHGSIEVKSPVFRNFKHCRMNIEEESEQFPFLKELQNTSGSKVTVIDDALLMLSAGMEKIQELHDAFLNEGSTTEVVFDGTVDTFYLCDRNKRIFNKLLELNNLQQFQPETWYYQYDTENTFEPPTDIPYFIIKPMHESLGKGVMLVSNEDLLTLLQALKTGIDFPKTVGDIDYYRRAQNKQVLIQRFYPGKSINYMAEAYRPTARAVFAVVKKEDSLTVDIIDIFWKIPNKPIQSSRPRASDSVSYSGKSARVVSQISLQQNEYVEIEKALKEKLTVMSTGIYNFDIKSYLFKLHETNQVEEIKYYLNNYAHVRVKRLDEEFISLILTVDEKKAMAFLVEQAKTFALPWHLKYANTGLKMWIDENLAQLEPTLLTDLQTFYRDQKTSISGTGLTDKELIIKEYDGYLSKISDLLEGIKITQEVQVVQMSSFKQNQTQTFFKEKPVPASEGQVTTPLYTA